MILLNWVKKIFTGIVAAKSNHIVNDIDFDDETCYGDIDFDDDICYDIDDKYSQSNRKSKRKVKTASKSF
ncbi:hypothetical protein H6G17_23265 [Chroococcidiopsis sp. FACHB-1243]|uniref:hypothetical protein n=1 Tax=Chroococcidiopsis sp. [FACHB-1243] TaxID=2692781 RepID=UPI00177D8965|nr:hypothetical protein [Chroococcidiopsis sp. [FACHB-1243]]MBD2308399.1 hypothetical protein [Chroococcidiopsis sp. [FACHB-1243]]